MAWLNIELEIFEGRDDRKTCRVDYDALGAKRQEYFYLCPDENVAELAGRAVWWIYQKHFGNEV